MKATFRTILCAAAAVLAAVSCQKSAEVEEPIAEEKGTIDIRIGGLMGEYSQQDGTKAELVNTVRVSWKGSETVYVYGGTQYLGYLTAALEGTEDRYAVLSGTITAPALGTVLTLVYSPLLSGAPTVSEGAISISLAEQNGAKVPFVVFATLDYNGEATIENAVVPFKFATSVIRVNSTGLKANTAISKATLSNVNTLCKLTLSGSAAPTVTGADNGTITRTGDTYFAAGKVNAEGEAVFQVAIPVLESTSEVRDLKVFQGSDVYRDKNFTKNDLATSTSVNTVCQMKYITGALPGVFSVSPTKKVQFSKGNLRYTVASEKWSFFDHQYECGPATYEEGHDKEISLFSWSYDKKKSIIPDHDFHHWMYYDLDETFSKENDWGYVFGGESSGWRTPTADEWRYLVGNGRHLKYGVTVCGKNDCLVLLPDNWDTSVLSFSNFDNISSYSESTTVKWSDMEAAGAVCLTCAGIRKGKQIEWPWDGFRYWTSTKALFLYNDIFEGITIMEEAECPGSPVRLVTDAN